MQNRLRDEKIAADTSVCRNKLRIKNITLFNKIEDKRDYT